jgi:NitT/TauT family transport system permease protein
MAPLSSVNNAHSAADRGYFRRLQSAYRAVRSPVLRRSLPFLTVAALVWCWQAEAVRHPHSILPGPWPVVRGIAELWSRGLLLKYVVASLFRVTWGYLSAVTLAVPFGLLLGWYPRVGSAVGPLLQVLRPISPLAWIPISILWFGVGDLTAGFLIFLAAFLPLTVASMNTVRNLETNHVRAGRNFGLSEAQLVRWVLYPAAMPQLIVALRIGLGIAWLVVVAAEMIAVNSGLGFLIVDARNAGNRYDLVVAGMVMIGVIGLMLDTAIRSLETRRSLRHGYGEAG